MYLCSMRGRARVYTYTYTRTHSDRDLFTHDTLTCVLVRALFFVCSFFFSLLPSFFRCMNKCMKVTTRNFISARVALSCYGLGFYVMLFFCSYLLPPTNQQRNSMPLLCCCCEFHCLRKAAQYTFQSKLQRIQIFLEH